eukprot:5496518-Prymnesium_polylepis.1
MEIGRMRERHGGTRDSLRMHPIGGGACARVRAGPTWNGLAALGKSTRPRMEIAHAVRKSRAWRVPRLAAIRRDSVCTPCVAVGMWDRGCGLCAIVRDRNGEKNCKL